MEEVQAIMKAGKRYMITTGNGTVEGTCIKIWERSANPQMIMSISSGPKDQLQNRAVSALDAIPSAEAVAYMHLPGKMGKEVRLPVPVFLYLIAGYWTDREGVKPIIHPSAVSEDGRKGFYPKGTT